MGLQFTAYIPTTLINVNSPSRTLVSETITGMPIASGSTPGSRFYLAEKLALQLSGNLCHAGWFRVVQVDAGANAANIVFGSVGGQVTLAGGASLVTDASHVLSLGLDPCVFLGTVTPGNYTIVQDSGDVSVLVAANQTVAVGTLLVATVAGTFAVSGAISNATLLTVMGVAQAALTTPAAITLSAVATASGGSTVYTGTVTGGGANAFAGLQFLVAGFANPLNNGTFVATASTATTLTLSNPNGVAITAAGSATSQGLVRALVNPLFTVIP